MRDRLCAHPRVKREGRLLLTRAQGWLLHTHQAMCHILRRAALNNYHVWYSTLHHSLFFEPLLQYIGDLGQFQEDPAALWVLQVQGNALDPLRTLQEAD